MKERVLRIVTSGSSASDGELVARIADGDLGALGMLYDRYAAMLLGFARKHSPAEDAEDVVQIAFLRAVDAARRFDCERSAKPWLFGIAVQVLRERRRALRRLCLALAEVARWPRAFGSGAEGAARDLSRALAKLSEAKRTVVLLAEVEGFSCQEIATILGVPVGTVWTRLHHARRELRASFEENP